MSFILWSDESMIVVVFSLFLDGWMMFTIFSLFLLVVLLVFVSAASVLFK